MWIGTLALAGFPLVSSAASKDSIIASGLELGGTWGLLAFVGGTAGALLTGIYASRLMLVVFHGTASEETAHTAEHHTAHGEGPRSMLFPVYALAALTFVGGVLQFPSVTTSFSRWLEPITYGAPAMLEPSSGNEWIATACAGGAGILGILVAWRLWAHGRTAPVAFPRPLAVLSERRFFFDELYRYAFYVPAVALANGLTRFVERPVLLLAPDAAGSLATLVSRRIGVVANGIVRVYALAFALGVIGLVLYFTVQSA
jgi:NADH-quinone oxidoreductase subunit L